MNNTITNKASHGKLLDYISPEIIIPITMIYFAVIYSLRFSWYLGGAIMLIMPVIEYAAIMINSIKRKRKLILPASYIVIAYFAYITIRHVFSLDIMTMGVSDAVISAFALTCMQAQKKEEFIRIFYRVCMTFMWISIISGILSLLTLLIPESIKTDTALPEFIRTNLQIKYTARTDTGLSRLVGIYTNPNPTAHHCVFGLMFGVGTVLLKPQKIGNYIYLLLDFMITVSILILTESRASMLSFAIFCLVFIVIYFWGIRKCMIDNSKVIDTIIIVVLCFALCLLLAFIFIEPLRAKILEILRVPYSKGMPISDMMNSIWQKFESASNRDLLRASTLQSWHENILFGISASEIVSRFPFDGIGFQAGSHNSYIQILATTGLIGIALFLTLQVSNLICLILTIKKTNDKRIRITCLFILTIFIAAIVDNQFEVYFYSNVNVVQHVNFYVMTFGFQALNLLKDEKDA